MELWDANEGVIAGLGGRGPYVREVRKVLWSGVGCVRGVVLRVGCG